MLHEEGVPLLAGSDFGGVPLVFPGFSLHEELQLLVHHTGMTPLEALQTATWKPPRFFGMQDEVGTIEVGKIADLVLLRADPLDDIRNTQEIEAVLSGGRFFYRAALDAMLAEAEEMIEPSP
jgi:imidazolonepropionase-like amidohydrolase